MPSVTPLARRIRKLRVRQRLSLNGLAQKVNVSKTTIFEWEAGTHAPRSQRLGALADALDVTVGQLLGTEAA